MKLNNSYFILRHAESKANSQEIVSIWPEKFYNPLTKKGKEQIKKIIPELKNKKIDFIFSSDLLRAKQTAEIIAKSLDLEIKIDKRLREINVGAFNGKSADEWYNFFNQPMERFTKRPLKGENLVDVKKRILGFIREIDKKYKNKRILIVSHKDTLLALLGVIKEFSNKELIINHDRLALNTGELKKL